MAWEKRVVWSEGMMLQPQHFQQQSRYHEAQLRQAIDVCLAHPWGFLRIDLDHSLLNAGKLAINRASGLFNDGTLFNLPDTDRLPDAIHLDKSHLDATIYLALPIRRENLNEVNRENNALGRYHLGESEVSDVSGLTSNTSIVEISGLNCCLRTSLQDNSEYVCIPFAQIDDVSPNGAISLSANYIPPTLNIKTSPVLTAFASELVNLTKHRVQSLAARVSVAGKSTSGEVVDFIMLQTLNRHLPVLSHIHSMTHVSPHYFYEKLIMLVGDMCTLIQADKMLPALPDYQHGELNAVFNPLIEELRALFSVVLEQNSINIPLEEKKFGIRVGKVSDKSLFSSASFILAISADVSSEDIRRYFPQQVKIGSVESIKELVNLQLPGIQLNHLAAAPREIPYQRQFVYFELVQSGEYWQALQTSGGIACHIGTNFPNLNMELWAIRN